jgi:hypothetical protein
MATQKNGGAPPVVPIVSSSAVGPLGVRHLPRMWLKVLLHAKGRLPKGYRHGTGGFDETTARNLGFDRDDFIDFVCSKHPTYLETEIWVREHATNLTEEAIRKHNESVVRDKPELMAKVQRAFVGLDDEKILDATLLNDLDDWHTLHTQITKGELPPLLVSSFNAEMTEVLKELLVATSANRVAMHVDLAAFDFEPSKPVVEVKAAVHHGDEIAKSEIVRGGKPIAWISVYGTRQWSEDDSIELDHAVTRAGEILDEVSLTPV